MAEEASVDLVVWPPMDLPPLDFMKRLSVQECLYRNIGQTKHLSVHDFDEILVSHSESVSLSGILKAMGAYVIVVKDAMKISRKRLFIVRPDFIFDLNVDSSIIPLFKEIKVSHTKLFGAI